MKHYCTLVALLLACGVMYSLTLAVSENGDDKEQNSQLEEPRQMTNLAEPSENPDDESLPIERRARRRACGSQKRGCPRGKKCLTHCARKCVSARKKGDACKTLDADCDPGTDKYSYDMCGSEKNEYGTIIDSVQCGGSKWSKCSAKTFRNCTKDEECCSKPHVNNDDELGLCGFNDHKCYPHDLKKEKTCVKANGTCKSKSDCCNPRNWPNVGGCMDGKCVDCARAYTDHILGTYDCCPKDDYGGTTIYITADGKCDSCEEKGKECNLGKIDCCGLAEKVNCPFDPAKMECCTEEGKKKGDYNCKKDWKDNTKCCDQKTKGKQKATGSCHDMSTEVNKKCCVSSGKYTSKCDTTEMAGSNKTLWDPDCCYEEGKYLFSCSKGKC